MASIELRDETRDALEGFLISRSWPCAEDVGCHEIAGVIGLCTAMGLYESAAEWLKDHREGDSCKGECADLSNGDVVPAAAVGDDQPNMVDTAESVTVERGDEPAPRVEVIAVRDPDSQTNIHVFVDGGNSIE